MFDTFDTFDIFEIDLFYIGIDFIYSNTNVLFGLLSFLIFKF